MELLSHTALGCLTWVRGGGVFHQLLPLRLALSFNDKQSRGSDFASKEIIRNYKNAPTIHGTLRRRLPYLSLSLGAPEEF